VELQGKKNKSKKVRCFFVTGLNFFIALKGKKGGCLDVAPPKFLDYFFLTDFKYGLQYEISRESVQWDAH
jgi:hypothetical protein